MVRHYFLVALSGPHRQSILKKTTKIVKTSGNSNYKNVWPISRDMRAKSAIILITIGGGPQRAFCSKENFALGHPRAAQTFYHTYYFADHDIM